MIPLINCFLLVIVIFTHNAVYAQTYYVKNNGSDSHSGLSDEKAWKTIGKINSHRFKSGDMVLLKRNSVFSDASLKNPGVNNFTIADYGAGAKPRIDGNSVAPINILPSSPISNLTIKNIDIGGQEWSSLKGSNIVVTNVNNILIDGVTGNGYEGSKSPEGKTAITLNNCKGNVVIRNCNLSNWGPKKILEATQDFMGIVIYQQSEGQYLIENCVIQNIGADGIHLFDSVAHGKVIDNTVMDCGEEAIDVKGSDNVKIFNNQFERSEGFIGKGGTGVNYPAHVKIHNGRFRSTSSKIVISGNYFKKGDAVGVLTADSSDILIKNNSFYNMPTFIKIGNNANDTIIKDNVFHTPISRKVGARSLEAGGIFESNQGKGTKIVNNVFFNEKGSSTTMITLGCSFETEISKNIIYNAPTNPNVSYAIHKNSCSKNPIISENCMYTASHDHFKYEGEYSENQIETISQTNHFSKPQFINAANGNLNLKEETPCKSNGQIWGASNPLLNLDVKLKIKKD